jgi:GMP synthase (glutamine-hydrolysing)
MVDAKRLTRPFIAVLDFGGQYAHLIANRIRRLGEYSVILPPDCAASDLEGAVGIILSGGPGSVYDSIQPPFNTELFETNIPILGLCYGHQLLAQQMGGNVARGEVREYGQATVSLGKKSKLFSGMDDREAVWMSHGDQIVQLPEGFEVLGSTDDCPVAAMGDEERNLYGLQFHPEVTHTPNGMQILENFLDICDAERSWNPGNYVDEISASLKERIGSDRVLLLVSGGVDSSVCFAMLNRAVGPDQVVGVHINNGLMRKEESALVVRSFEEQGYANLNYLDASEEFLGALVGVTDPEEKRRIIGRVFVEVAASQVGDLHLDEGWLLAQGTIYPDTIETGGTEHAATIKTHHNRVEEIERLLEQGKIVEPLADLYKDEVREEEKRLLDKSEREAELISSSSGCEARILPIKSVGVQGDFRTYGHPVALSGGIRDWSVLEEISTRLTNAIGEVNRVVYALSHRSLGVIKPVEAHVTADRISLLQEADAVASNILHRSNHDREVWQMPVVLLPLSVDGRGECIVIRPISSEEAMTARFTALPWEIVDEISAEIFSLAGPRSAPWMGFQQCLSISLINHPAQSSGNSLRAIPLD